MFIIGRTGLTYARLAFAAGPGAHLHLPVAVDWSAWPAEMLSARLDEQMAQWANEYDAHIHPERFFGMEEILEAGAGEIDIRDMTDSKGNFTGWWDYEDYEPRDPILQSEIEVRSRAIAFARHPILLRILALAPSSQCCYSLPLVAKLRSF